MATALAPSPTRPVSPPPAPLLFLAVIDEALVLGEHNASSSISLHNRSAAVQVTSTTSSPHNSRDHRASAAATALEVASPVSRWAWMAESSPLSNERSSPEVGDNSASASASRSTTASSSTSDLSSLSSGSPPELQLHGDAFPLLLDVEPCGTLGELDRLALRQWSFAASANPDLHGALFVDMFTQLGLVSQFGLCTERLYALWLAVRSSYRDNPYHNAVHAFDVTQCLFAYLISGGAAAVLEPLEQLALLLAGIMHDLEHPGVSNDFCVRTDHPLVASALEQQQQQRPSAAVLETHHVSRAGELLCDAQIAALESLTSAQKQRVLELIPDLIIATYMGDHERYLTALTDSIASGLPATAPEFRLTLMQILLKGADLSNVARPFPVARFWATAIEAEFFQEGDMLRKLGLTCAPHLERSSPTPLALKQCFFIDHFALPLFRLISHVLPDTKPFLDECLATRASWLASQTHPLSLVPSS